MNITLLDCNERPIKKVEELNTFEIGWDDLWLVFSWLTFGTVWWAQMIKMLWVSDELELIDKEKNEQHLEHFFSIAKSWKNMQAFSACSNIVFYLERNEIQLKFHHFISLLDTDYCRNEWINTDSFHGVFYWWQVYHFMVYETDRKEVATHFSKKEILSSFVLIIKNAIYHWNDEVIYSIIPMMLEKMNAQSDDDYKIYYELWKLMRELHFSKRIPLLNSIKNVDDPLRLVEQLHVIKEDLVREKKILSIEDIILWSVTDYLDSIVSKKLWYKSLYLSYFSTLINTNDAWLEVYWASIPTLREKIISSIKTENNLLAPWIIDWVNKERRFTLDKISTRLLENFTATIDGYSSYINTQIIEKLQKLWWLYSIWWKLHFRNGIDKEKLDAFKKEHFFLSTCFTMIHANESMLLPAVYSAEELTLIICILIENWLTEWETELQLSIPWRLPNKLAWVLWSAILLLTDRNVEYAENAFSTTHDTDTWAKIMAYDAWVLELWFKNNPHNNIWRTDMLWRVSTLDIYHYQVIWSLVSQSIHWWPLKNLGKQFVFEYEELLKVHWYDMFLENQWVYDVEHDTLESQESHFALIKQRTDKRNEDRITYKMYWSWEWILSYEIKNLLKIYLNKIKSIT